jgi:hypothetical protein
MLVQVATDKGKLARLHALNGAAPYIIGLDIHPNNTETRRRCSTGETHFSSQMMRAISSSMLVEQQDGQPGEGI